MKPHLPILVHLFPTTSQLLSLGRLTCHAWTQTLYASRPNNLISWRLHRLVILCIFSHTVLSLSLQLHLATYCLLFEIQLLTPTLEEKIVQHHGEHGLLLSLTCLSRSSPTSFLWDLGSECQCPHDNQQVNSICLDLL